MHMSTAMTMTGNIAIYNYNQDAAREMSRAESDWTTIINSDQDEAKKKCSAVAGDRQHMSRSDQEVKNRKKHARERLMLGID